MILLYILIVVFVLIISLVLLSKMNFTHRKFIKLVEENNVLQETYIIQEEDLNGLPELVKNYLNYVGVVGKEQVLNYSVIFTGEMKIDETKEYAPVVVEQVSFKEGTRLFYMDMIFNGLKISGLHHFQDSNASMKIKILDLFTIVNESGGLMNQAETVTLLNDICLLAPSLLIDDRITFEEVDESHVKVFLNNNDIMVSALLTFDTEGKLTDFYSEDRYYLNGDVMESVPWSTPIYEYKDINGYKLPSIGEAVWHFEDRDFIYIKLNIEDVVYNAL